MKVDTKESEPAVFEANLVKDSTKIGYICALPLILVSILALQPSVAQTTQAAWVDDDFATLPTGRLHGKAGWRGRPSARVVAEPGHDHVKLIDPPANANISMNKNVPNQGSGWHRFEFDVKIRDATEASVAKYELRTTPNNGWNKKIQIYFGTSIRVNYHPSGSATVLVPTVEDGRWYHIEFDLDLDNDVFNVRVDGVEVVQGNAMHSGPLTGLSVAAWGFREGAVYVDNLLGVPLEPWPPSPDGDPGTGPDYRLQKVEVIAVDVSGEYAVPDFAMDMTTDGNPITIWSTPTRDAAQEEFLTLDLGRDIKIGRIRFQARDDHSHLLPEDFKIQVSADNLNFITVYSESSFVGADKSWYGFDFTPTLARYVRLLVTKAGLQPSNQRHYVQLAELEVSEAIAAGTAPITPPGKTNSSSLEDNRNRLLADYADREGKTACDAWNALDDAGRGVFIWNTHRLSLYEVYNCGDHPDGSGPNWWNTECQQYRFPALGRTDVQIPEIGGFSSGGTMLEHIDGVYAIWGETPGSNECGDGDDNRMIMSMTEDLWSALNWAGVGKTIAVVSRHPFGQLCLLPGVFCSTDPTYRPSIVHRGGGVNDAAFASSTDPSGPHEPFNISRESWQSNPTAQLHLFGRRVNTYSGCGTNLDPNIIGCETHGLQENESVCGRDGRDGLPSFCYRVTSVSDAVSTTFTRRGLHINDPYLLEMDQDKPVPGHPSNPECPGEKETYTDNYGDPNWDWIPAACGISGPPAPVCDDNICSHGETCSSCPSDCGECTGLNDLDTNVLNKGDKIKANEYIRSNNGRYRLVYQGDGNLVLYKDGNTVIWNSNTAGTSAKHAIMQGDGNFVVYDTGMFPRWASGTSPNGHRLVLQNSGNLHIWDGSGNVIWDTGASTGGGSNTGGGGSNDDGGNTGGDGSNGLGNRLNVGDNLNPGQYTRSTDGRFKLVYQADGNLVLYMNDNTALWDSGTNGATANKASFQYDGNFVVYDAGNAPRWASGTHPTAHKLIVQNDGNVVIYDANNSPLWATDTCCR